MRTCSALPFRVASLLANERMSRLHSERQLEQRTLDNSSQAYDRNLLSRIGGPNTPNRLSISYPSPGGIENPSVSPSVESRPDHSRHPSTSSERQYLSLDNSTLRTSKSTSGAVSPGSGRNPSFFDPENSRPTAHRHLSFPFDDITSHRSSYDQSMFMSEDFVMEEGQMKDLNLNDRNGSMTEDQLKAGMKRRASSPHAEATREERSSVSSAPGGVDLYTRRSIQQMPNRHSPVSRYAPNHGSISSISSLGPRNGSMASSYGLSVASSATSYTSGRISPGNISPAIDPELGALSYSAHRQMNPSPGSPPVVINHQRTFSEAPINNAPYVQDGAPQSRQNSIPGAQGVLVCDCCPKKPKKFSNEEELRYFQCSHTTPD